MSTAFAGVSRWASGALRPVRCGSMRWQARSRERAPRRHSCARLVRAALADIEPLSDLHASADYRRRAAAHLAVRAITDAYHAAAGPDAG